jgi:hypothetical protein
VGPVRGFGRSPSCSGRGPRALESAVTFCPLSFFARCSKFGLSIIYPLTFQITQNELITWKMTQQTRLFDLPALRILPRSR